MGLVDFLVPPEQLHKEAQSYALMLTKKPAEALPLLGVPLLKEEDFPSMKACKWNTKPLYGWREPQISKKAFAHFLKNANQTGLKRLRE